MTAARAATAVSVTSNGDSRRRGLGVVYFRGDTSCKNRRYFGRTPIKHSDVFIATTKMQLSITMVLVTQKY
jgi:hypothetical protein